MNRKEAQQKAMGLFPGEIGNVEDDINAYKRKIFMMGFDFAQEIPNSGPAEKLKEVNIAYNLSVRKHWVIKDTSGYHDLYRLGNGKWFKSCFTWVGGNLVRAILEISENEAKALLEASGNL